MEVVFVHGEEMFCFVVVVVVVIVVVVGDGAIACGRRLEGKRAVLRGAGGGQVIV